MEHPDQKILHRAVEKQWLTQSECEEILKKQLQEKAGEPSQSLKNILLEEGLFSLSMFSSLEKELSSSGGEEGIFEIKHLFQEMGRGGDPFVFGDYEIFDFINSGGMGAVYKARHRASGKIFAMKISSFTEGSEKKHLRFVREIKILSRIARHPNLIGIHDFGYEGGFDFLVMDYLEGESLNRALPGSSFSHQEWLYKFIPLLGAVEKLHEIGILHRDIKPENLILTKKKKLVLIDFGLGKILDPSESVPVQLTTHILGTPYYMAPEQTEPGGQHDHRTDIWALGVILYQMMAKILPFQNNDIHKLFSAIRHQALPSLLAIDKTIPPCMEAICKKALEKNKKDRYQSVGEMKENLKEGLSITSL